MRVPLSWLGEFVDLAPGTTPEDVHAALVRVGLEEEDLHRFELTGPIVVGRVLAFEEEPQANGKTIRWCQVDVGDAEPRGIVCGARNFFVGDLVVVTLPGAVLPGPFPIAARKTYGHVSDGMIASSRELGLGDDHDGILRLVTLGIDPIDPAAAPGTDALTLLGLDDSAVELNVTPDRGYAFSIRGVAREYSHSTGAAFRDPVAAVAARASAPTADVAGAFPVSLADNAPIRGRAGCSVFATLIVRGVDATRPTPPWMVARLKLAGIRSLSVLVDITNYVMLELGQPIHGYDLDHLRGGIVVRRAGAGETLETLDGKVRTLHAEDLLITDDRGAIGLAGVMGGADTEMSDATVNVLIEAAHFDPVSIARTARRHKLPSEASKRFERGVDPTIAAASAARVAELIVELAGGTVDGAANVVGAAAAREPIALAADAVSRLVGFEVAAGDIVRTLTEVGCVVAEASDAADSGSGATPSHARHAAPSGTGWSVTPPSWRPDLTHAEDLVEEVARLVGYDQIPSVLPVAPPGRGLTAAQRARTRAADALAAAGLTEVLAYPFVSEADNLAYGSADGTPVASVRVANALDGTVPVLRRSLVPGLIGVARRNLSRGLTDLAIFEIGSVFLPEAGRTYGAAPLPAGAELPTADVIAELNGGIPPQPRHLAVLALGNRVSKQPGQGAEASGLADVLDAARAAAHAVGVSIDVAQGSHHSLHPGRTASLSVAGPGGVSTVVGFAGELHPQVAADADLPRVVAVAELNLDAIIAAAPALVEAQPIGTFPAATQDLSLIVATDIAASAVAAAVREGAGELLEHLTLVDDYRGQGVPDGSKSLTFALRFRGADRTLTAAEASEAKLAGVAVAAERFGATTRE
ncbi:MAG TPA: phenylalanine--tRNA ligase subunit beta [Candidatus Lumbricidophila sp.]|nr:phenylalanine--tRNA ligase subunit beta [Candidatus Lumbricidophila sp.]